MQATMEAEGVESTPPPSYTEVATEIELHPSDGSAGERSSLYGSHDALSSDCTTSTELELGQEAVSENCKREGGVRHGSSESCESTC